MDCKSFPAINVNCDMKAAIGSNSVLKKKRRKKEAVVLTKPACPSNCPLEKIRAEVQINVRVQQTVITFNWRQVRHSSTV